MVNDPISDFLARIKNGCLAKKDFVQAPYSKIKKEIASVMLKNGYLEKVEIEKTSLNEKAEKNKKQKNARKEIKVSLKYENGEPKIENIKRVSKPGMRIYIDKNSIPYVLNGYGMAVISTSKGLMTDKQARKAKIGGELICKIW